MNEARDASRGRRALNRAKGAGAKTRGGGVPMAKLAPEVMRMVEMGMNTPQIAKAINRSERYVRTLKRVGREQGTSVFVELPDPKTIGEMEPEYAALLEPTADAFEEFFIEFSEYDYLPAHLKTAVADALAHHRMMVNMPPGHAKSEVFSVWFPIWLICQDRNVQIILLSKTEPLAKRAARGISVQLEQNVPLIQAYGRFKPETDIQPWQPLSGALSVAGRDLTSTTGDMTIQVKGGHQQILGMRAHWVILDDPTDEKLSDSETERETLEKRVDGEAVSRLMPGGHAICVGQRVHMFDIYDHLEKKKVRRGPRAGEPVWVVHRMPAVAKWPTETEEAEVLWPEHWSFDELMDRYDDQGEALFETMYQQNPMPLGERIVKPEWIYGDGEYRGCLDTDRGAGQGYRTLGDLPVVRVVSIDPSPKNYTGICVADVAGAGSTFVAAVIEISHEKGLGLRDLVNEIDRCLKMYAPVDYMIFEESTFSHWLYEDPFFQQLRHQIKVIPHYTNAKTKGDPELGIRSLAIEFEKGAIRLPYGNPEAKDMSDRFIEEELFTYPQGKVDDRLDALWFIKSRWKTLLPRKQVNTTVPGVKSQGLVWRKYNRDPRKLKEMARGRR